MAECRGKAFDVAGMADVDWTEAGSGSGKEIQQFGIELVGEEASVSEQEFYPRDSRQPGHFWADNEVLDVYGPQLGAHGFAVYMAMTRYAVNGTGECRMSTRRLAERLGMSPTGVLNAMNLIVEMSLAVKLEAGDRRSCAVYILSDVKSLLHPEYAQLRLAGKGVHPVNTERKGVHPMHTGVNPVDAGVHPVNDVSTGWTRNKERKTFTRLDLKTSPSPSAPEGNLKIPTRKRDQLKIDQEIRRLVKSSDCPLQGKLVVIQAAVNLGFDPQYVNYMGGSDCPFHPENQSVTQNGNCWACYSEKHESGCLPA